MGEITIMRELVTKSSKSPQPERDREEDEGTDMEVVENKNDDIHAMGGKRLRETCRYVWQDSMEHIHESRKIIETEILSKKTRKYEPAE